MNQKIIHLVFLFLAVISLSGNELFSQIGIPNEDVLSIVEKNRPYSYRNALLYVTVYKWTNDRWNEKGRYQCTYVESGEMVCLRYDSFSSGNYTPVHQYLYDHDHALSKRIVSKTYQIYSNNRPVNSERCNFYYSGDRLDSILYEQYGSYWVKTTIARCCYNKQGLDTSILYYSYGNESAGAGKRYMLLYDSLGNRTYEAEEHWADTTWRTMTALWNNYDENNLLTGRTGGAYNLMGFLEIGLFEDMIYDSKKRPITKKEKFVIHKTLTDYYYDNADYLLFAQKRVLYKNDLSVSKSDTVRNDSMFVYTYFNTGTNNAVKRNKTLSNNFYLLNNYPNPFNPSTQIKFYLPKRADVKLTVYNILGEEIITLANGELPAGEYETIFNARDLSSGVYFYKLHTNEGTLTKKMLLAK